MKKITFIGIVTCMSCWLLASSSEVLAQVGIGTAAPMTHAQLDVRSSDKGLLVPRLTTSGRTSLGSALIAANDPLNAGMQVYDTDLQKLYIWNEINDTWDEVATGSAVGPWTESGMDIYPATLTNRVGIGTASPITRLDVQTENVNEDYMEPVARLIHRSTGTAQQGIGASLIFATENDGDAEVEAGSVGARLDDVTNGNETGSLVFATRTGSYLEDHMSLSSQGFLGIGSAFNPEFRLELRSSSDVTIKSFNDDAYQAAALTGSYQSRLEFSKDLVFEYEPNANDVGRGTGTERMRIEGSTGNVGIGNPLPYAALHVNRQFNGLSGDEITGIFEANAAPPSASSAHTIAVTGQAQTLDVGSNLSAAKLSGVFGQANHRSGTVLGSAVGVEAQVTNTSGELIEAIGSSSRIVNGSNDDLVTATAYKATAYNAGDHIQNLRGLDFSVENSSYGEITSITGVRIQNPDNPGSGDIQNVTGIELAELNAGSVSNRAIVYNHSVRPFLVNGNGHVGIGTATPAQLLDVSGNSIFRGQLDMNTANRIVNLQNPVNPQDAATKNYVDAATSPGNFIQNQNAVDQTASFRISGTGQIAGNAEINGGQLGMFNPTSNWIRFIGNTAVPSFTTRSPGTRLILNPNLSGSSTDYAIGVAPNEQWYSVTQNATAFAHRFYGGTTPLMTIRGDGNVGIGTTSPSTRLYVEGPATAPAPYAIIGGGGSVTSQTNLRLQDNGTAANSEIVQEFAFSDVGPVVGARIRAVSPSANMATGSNLRLETYFNNSGGLNANQLTLFRNGTVGIAGGEDLGKAIVGTLAPPGGEGTVSNDVPLINASSLIVSSPTHNGGATPAPAEPVLTLWRSGVASSGWMNIAQFKLSKYASGAAAQTRLHIGMTNGINDPNASDVMVLQGNGNVGIGTVNPAQKLHVFGGNQTMIAVETGAGVADVGYRLIANGTQWDMQISRWEVGSTRFSIGNGPGTVNNHFNILPTGQVGLKENNPTERFVVLDGNILLSNNTNTAGQIIFREPSAAGTNFTAFRAQAQTADITYTLPAAQGAAGTMLTNNGSGGLSWTTPTGDNLGNHRATTGLDMQENSIRLAGLSDVNHALRFSSPSGSPFNGVDVNGPVLHGFLGGVLGTKQAAIENIALYWNSNGRVAIGGNTNPTHPLDVTGNTLLRGTGEVLGGDFALNNLTSNFIRFNTAGSAAPTFTTRSQGTKLVLYPNISGTTADFALGIQGASMWYSVDQAAATRAHIFYGGTTELMRITGTGRMGINGINSPIEVLSVNGNINLDDAAALSAPNRTIGYTTDALGNHGSLIFKAKGTPISGTAYTGGDVVLTAGNYNVASTLGSRGGNVLIQAGRNMQGIANTESGDIIFQTGATGLATRMQIKGSNGRIGIGTAAPNAPLHVVGNNSGNVGAFAFYAAAGCNVSTGNCGGAINDYSIIASNRIAATEFNAYSDARIKNVTSLTQPDEDLATINRLQVTNFTYKDIATNGADEKKGFIAQQVETVFPQAVSKNQDFIPNIYQVAEVVEQDNLTLILRLPQMHDLVATDTIRIITQNGQMEKPVRSILPDGSIVLEHVSEPVTQAFIFGKKVSDFRTVDYDRIYTAGIGAIQALSKKVVVLENVNSDLSKDNLLLRAEMERLKQEFAQMSEEKQRLESSIATEQANRSLLEERLNRLEKYVYSQTDIPTHAANSR